MATQIRSSVCMLDCPDTCSLDVEVTDGKVGKIKGSSINRTTAGFICSKVAQFSKRVHGEERLRFPMRRTGKKGEAEFERITWQDAIRTICDRAQDIKQTWGGEAILPYSYGGSNGLLGQDTIDRAFFAKLGASRLEPHRLRSANRHRLPPGLYGKMPGVAFEDYAEARFIIIWGANPKVSHIHLIPFLKAAKSRGAKIAVIDPVLNFSDREIDYHLPVYPGTDVAVALGMVHHWNRTGQLDWDFIRSQTSGIEFLLQQAEQYDLEKAAATAGVDAGLLQRVADEYAGSRPAVIRIGWGLERNRNGGQAVAAILAIPAVMGKFGLKGGGYTLSNSGAYHYRDEEVVAYQPWKTRRLNMNQLGQFLTRDLKPPIKMLFVYNCNPVATVPNQNAIIAGMQRDDLFTVVFEQVMTDTARYADLILPAVTFLEQQEVKKAYGSYALQYLEPAIPAVGESKPNEEVFAMLGRQMGWTDPVFKLSTDELVDRTIGAVQGINGDASSAKLKQDKVAYFDFPSPHPIQFKTVFPGTPDRKVHLAPEQLGERAYEFDDNPENSEYPLSLISPATRRSINSTMAEYNLPSLILTMNPEDAAARNLRDGEPVRVFNDHGEVHCHVRISRSIRAGVVDLPKGAWRRCSLNGQTSTSLAPDFVSRIGGGACFNDARVQVTSLEV